MSKAIDFTLFLFVTGFTVGLSCLAGKLQSDRQVCR